MLDNQVGLLTSANAELVDLMLLYFPSLPTHLFPSLLLSPSVSLFPSLISSFLALPPPFLPYHLIPSFLILSLSTSLFPSLISSFPSLPDDDEAHLTEPSGPLQGEQETFPGAAGLLLRQL